MNISYLKKQLISANSAILDFPEPGEPERAIEVLGNIPSALLH